MYYLKDNKTGQKYELSSNKMFLARLIPIVSFTLYGMIIALALSFSELSGQTFFMYLAVAYIIESVLWFTNKISVGKCIGAVLLIISWRPIFIQIFTSSDMKNNNAICQNISEFIKLCKVWESNAVFSYSNHHILHTSD